MVPGHKKKKPLEVLDYRPKLTFTASWKENRQSVDQLVEG